MEIKKIGDICKLRQGFQVALPEQEINYKDGFVRFIRIVDYTQKTNDIRYVRDSEKYYYVKEDDVVMIRYGASAGEVGSGINGVIANNMFLIEPVIDINKRYMYYYLSQKRTRDKLFASTTSSAMPALNFQIVNELEIPLWDNEMQAKIVSIFDKLSVIIKKRRDEIEYLDDLIKARFVELFGDTATNPMKWDRITFKEASIRLSDGPFGSNLKSEHYSESGIRVIRLGNIGVGEFIDNDKSFIPLEHYERLKKYTCKKGEIVIGTLGEPNLRACLVPEYIEVAVNKADCVHYVPNPKLLDNQFVCQYINCPETLQLAAGMIHGQTRARVSSGQIANMPIYLPPMELQLKFAGFVKQVNKSRFVVQKALDEAQLLFDNLMQEYFV